MILSDAARALGVDPTTLRKQIANGRLVATLTSSPVGRFYEVTEEEVARYARESRGKPGRPRKKETER